MSKHERGQLRMQERIAKLEAQNMADKDWFMQGEAGAGQCSLIVRTTSADDYFLLQSRFVLLACEASAMLHLLSCPTMPFTFALPAWKAVAQT